MNAVAAVLFRLSRWDDIDGFLFRDPGDCAALHGWPVRTAPAGGKQLNRNLIADRELRKSLLRGVKVRELRLGAADPDLARRRVDKVERNQPGKPTPALRLHHDMSHRASGGVDDYGQYLPAVPVTAYSFASEHECYHHRASLYPGP